MILRAKLLTNPAAIVSARSDPLEAREARLLGLDMPTKLAVTDPDGDGIPLEAIRRVMDRLDRANEETVDVTPEPGPLPLDHKRQ
jgi:hypothetical protein